MTLLIVSFLAGILTVLAPCVLPVLPIIIGGAVQGRSRNPYIITGSLAAAIVLFTLLLKFSTVFINVPPAVWSYLSGIIITVFGVFSLFPTLWDRINARFGLSGRSDKLLAESGQVKSRWSDVLIGLSLGPVFSSCSPTYFLILATVLPRSLAAGTADLIAYAVGLSLVLLLVSVLGQRFISRARWAADPAGWFRRGLGVLFILVGIFILTGWDQHFQVYVGGYYPLSNLERSLLVAVQRPAAGGEACTSTAAGSGVTTCTSSQPLPPLPVDRAFPRYREIADPAGFINSAPFTIGSLIGKKIILVDFMAYSCINCIRTFPYLNAWYEKYHSQGLEIVGIHTPEFAFERNPKNVQKALLAYGIKFPVVLDNNYGAWNAYGNQYWPDKYLIDIDGDVVYEHAGEGNYDETEQKIQELLAQKMARVNAGVAAMPSGLVNPVGVQSADGNSPETYFGSDRNDYLANGRRGVAGEQKLMLPPNPGLNELNLGGQWNFTSQYASVLAANDQVVYRYNAHNMFLVAGADAPVRVRILRDGVPLTPAIGGKDVYFKDGQSYVDISDERLYSIVMDGGPIGDHTIELIIESAGLRCYTFTFG